jgi:hypothetical protein
MRKGSIILLIVLVIPACWILPPAWTEEYPDVWNEDYTGFSAGWVEKIFRQRQRPPSRFDHDTHQGYEGLEECHTCHHLYEDGLLIEDESSEDQACADCHPVRSTRSRPTKLLSAYHNLCKGCHEQVEDGPLTCGECHVK